MNIDSTPFSVPNRILYTMIRVADLDKSIAFYKDCLGMAEIRRETFPDGRFTLVFMGYGDEASGATIELTWNWDDGEYTHGSGFGHIALGVKNIAASIAHVTASGGKVVRAPGPMTVAPVETGEREVIAFIEDPDGYKIELIEDV